MRQTAFGLLLFGVSLMGVEAAFSREAKQPNVLFISVDDLNDWIGCLHGHPQAKTPNIDRLAASGILFTNAHCAAPACNPSRTAIMTGISPHRSGLYDNRQKMREILPNELSVFFFTASGSEANDTVFRLVRRYWQLQAQPEKIIIIGRNNGFILAHYTH